LGIFDFLRKSSPPPGGAPTDKKVAGPARVVADKRAQTYDRLEAIQTLCAMKSVDAATALLQRFKFAIDPSITDQEEKELAYEGILEAGKSVVPAVREFCVKAESLTWPLKVLRELLDDEAYRAEMVQLLERFDTEYARNVDPKVQTIIALEDVPAATEVREAIERFLEDVNETVRFHAIQTTFVQENEESVPALVRMLGAEESVRVKNKAAEGLTQRGWVIPEDQRDAMKAALRDTQGYALSGDGKVIKR
jgi:hypothetical protein